MNSKSVIALLTEMPQHVLRGSWQDWKPRWTVEVYWPSTYEAVSLAIKRGLIHPSAEGQFRGNRRNKWIAPCVAIIPESNISGFKFPARLSKVVMLPDKLQADCHAFNAKSPHWYADRAPINAAAMSQETQERVDQAVKETKKLVSDYMEVIHPGLIPVVRTDQVIKSVEVHGTLATMVKKLVNFRYAYKPGVDELFAFFAASRPGDKMTKVFNASGSSNAAIYVLVGPDDQAAFDQVVRSDSSAFLKRRL